MKDDTTRADQVKVSLAINIAIRPSDGDRDHARSLRFQLTLLILATTARNTIKKRKLSLSQCNIGL